MQRLGKKSEFINGLRVTDAETRDMALMVLAGMVNKKLVSSICAAGKPAIGLCGGDGGTVRARKKESNDGDLGYVGEIREDQLSRQEFAGLDPGAIIGQSGVERVYNASLMGADGRRNVVVNSVGREIQPLGQDDPREGKRMQLTIDYDLQKALDDWATAEPKLSVLAPVSVTLPVLQLTFSEVMRPPNGPRPSRETISKLLSDPPDGQRDAMVETGNCTRHRLAVSPGARPEYGSGCAIKYGFDPATL